MHARVSLLLVVAAAFMGLCEASAEDTGPPFEQSVQPLLAKYCYKCHGGEKKEAELDLTVFKAQADAAGADIWEQVLGRINAVEMPPGENPQPNDEERNKLVRWLTRIVDGRSSDCNKIATDQTQRFYRGYVMSRRLTRAEYDNSIRDLVGLELKPSTLLPNDGSGGEGFDTNGDTLFTSAILLEKYLDAADLVLDNIWPETREPAPPHVIEARARLCPSQPSAELPPREAARNNLARFARRAFRRPVEGAEIERLLGLFDHATARGDSFDLALKLAFKAVLVSPHFLFLVEREPEKQGVYRLGQFELATRLAYFLWSSLPDEELLNLAEAGRLHDADVLRQQTARMLKDGKSRGLAENFMRQWLGIEALGSTVKPDPVRFPEFDAELADAMRAEAYLLLDNLLHEDRPLIELVDANYTFVNERLARHYAIPDVTGPEMRRVVLTERNRGGVLALGSVLAVTSFPLRTSPVLRGKWVLEQVLGSKVPPPPPNVPELPNDDARQGETSLRERLERHRADAACASCHQRMDPLGFGLENFDPIGRWREKYAVLEGGVLKPDGPPVDASGTLPSGEQFRGPIELKALVLKRSDEFVRHFVRKMYGYALGRALNKFDECVVNETLQALKAGDYRSSLLIEQVVQSFPFQHRYCKK
jgi:hypothetical protein